MKGSRPRVLNVGSSWRGCKYEVSLLQKLQPFHVLLTCHPKKQGKQAACDCHVPVTEEARQAGRCKAKTE
ncbi:hypothetical protein DY000_02024276 [Brassica cretica]|uniref:Uncharacterized protein n=1 Tax=Brassica cretica TaxID=69181 RepID=A0ABQ7EL72_BRACR|nr:hypothetical protein DY000_02024276 [Brassica cretica]